MKKIIYIILRVLFGLVFIFSGFVKAVDPMGFAYKMQDHLAVLGMEFFDPLTLPAAILLCAVEFVIGINFLLGVNIKSTSILALMFMGVMTPFTLYIAIVNPVTDCGCFGDALVIGNWETFFKNIVLLIFVIVVFLWRKTCQGNGFSALWQWIITLYAFISIVAVSIFCVLHLPIIDFRPYKIGANINEGMEIPENAPQDVYKTTFTYEKDGVQKKFDETNYPWQDSTWSFVDSKSELKQKGYEPPIHDFTIESDEYGDITDIVLSDENYSFLIISPSIEDANIAGAKKLNNIYDYAQNHEYGFYFMTPSLLDAVTAFSNEVLAEYPFYKTDEITLKTIVRSNPGLVLIKNGTVINKWHYNDFPEIPTDKRLDELAIGQLKEPQPWKVVCILGGVFLIPFIFIFYYGYSTKRNYKSRYY